jgi:hypothetical protein
MVACPVQRFHQPVPHIPSPPPAAPTSAADGPVILSNIISSLALTAPPRNRPSEATSIAGDGQRRHGGRRRRRQGRRDAGEAQGERDRAVLRAEDKEAARGNVQEGGHVPRVGHRGRQRHHPARRRAAEAVAAAAAAAAAVGGGAAGAGAKDAGNEGLEYRPAKVVEEVNLRYIYTYIYIYIYI